MRYNVVDDYWTSTREAFVVDDDELDEMDGYQGWTIVESFDSVEEAEKFCSAYNEYEGEPDVSFTCCSHGCTMCAYDAAHSCRCVHEGE